MVLFYAIITQNASIFKKKKISILIEYLEYQLYTEYLYPLAAKMWAPAVPAQEASSESATNQVEGAFHFAQHEMVDRCIHLLSIALINTLTKSHLDRNGFFHLTIYSHIYHERTS